MTVFGLKSSFAFSSLSTLCRELHSSERERGRKLKGSTSHILLTVALQPDSLASRWEVQEYPKYRSSFKKKLI